MSPLHRRRPHCALPLVSKRLPALFAPNHSGRRDWRPCFRAKSPSAHIDRDQGTGGGTRLFDRSNIRARLSNSFPEIKKFRGHASLKTPLLDAGVELDPRHDAQQLIQIKRALRTALFSTAPISKETATALSLRSLLAWFEWRSRLGPVLVTSPDAPSLGERCRMLGTLLLRCTNAARCKDGEAHEQPRHLRLKRKPRSSRARNSTRG
jgi:hypothetical protein